MAILLVRNDGLLAPWKNAFIRHARDIRVYGMGEEVPKGEVKMAAVWKHPPGSLAAFPNLLGIHGLGAGVDFIMEDVSIPPELPVMRVVDPFLASDMAEFVLAEVTGMLKRLQAYKYREFSARWEPRPYQRFSDVNIGIMGLGKLGLAVAGSLKAAGFSMVGWTRTSIPEVDFPVFQGDSQRNTFLGKAQVLVCLLPLTPETRGILNMELFRQMPAGARLVNVARGPLLREEDLLAALDQGVLSEACLDVFETEPLPETHPFWEHPDIHITPHIASVSDPVSVAPQIIENYRRLLRGEVPENLVSREAGY
jgi:glyoxylate/hydroxypyruvate reductase A